MSVSIDPDDELDFAFDWTARLEDSETIASQTVTPSDASITISRITEVAGVVTFWIDKPSTHTGFGVRVTCQVVTNQGRTENWSKTFYVTDL